MNSCTRLQATKGDDSGMMRSIIVYYDNQDSVATRINGTVDTIINYYLGKQFPFMDEKGREKMSTCRSIRFLDSTRFQHNGRSITVTRAVILSDAHMRRYNLTNKIRVEFIIHYTSTGTEVKSGCAYIPGMFDPY